MRDFASSGIFVTQDDAFDYTQPDPVRMRLYENLLSRVDMTLTDGSHTRSFTPNTPAAFAIQGNFLFSVEGNPVLNLTDRSLVNAPITLHRWAISPDTGDLNPASFSHSSLPALQNPSGTDSHAYLVDGYFQPKDMAVIDEDRIAILVQNPPGLLILNSEDLSPGLLDNENQPISFIPLSDKDRGNNYRIKIDLPNHVRVFHHEGIPYALISGERPVDEAQLLSRRDPVSHQVTLGFTPYEGNGFVGVINLARQYPSDCHGSRLHYLRQRREGRSSLGSKTLWNEPHSTFV
ncbi:MAG: hypothetical protein IPJ69_13015 [Deltaproteobacteria bacterium]|nr:MAG: hypothetical protein IPJ69_13015 [Deltaproteobacteria bacterium]